ncbi:MAG TPA: DUF5681 domain-containing protein [Dongiaceae bacterium]|nr:DUF5681 domain-containing protein [Dongiaceae bacterium]
MPADSLQKQGPGPGGPFQKGRSGNPAGRRPGSRNRATLAAEVLLDGEAEALTRKAVELALEGDTTALKLCLERVVPRRKSRALDVDVPPISKIEDLPTAIGSILQEAARGRLFLDEAAALVCMLESQRQALETIDLENRLKALEAEVVKQAAP